MIYDRIAALSVLGSMCNDLNLIRDRNYNLNLNDFDDMFHKIIFGSLQNLALEKDIKEISGFTLDMYLRNMPVQYATFNKNGGVDFIEQMRVMSKSSSFDRSYKMLKKFSLLRKYDSVGVSIKEIYDIDSIDVKLQEQQLKDLEKSSIDEIKLFFKKKFLAVDKEFQTKTDNYEFDAGDDLDFLVEECQRVKAWGLPFQSGYLNTVYGGMGLGKYILRSGGTGTGKSRLSIANMCFISCPEVFVVKENRWIRNNNPISTFFYSTELTKKEVQLIMLATVSGVPEETIKDGIYTKTERERIYRAKEIIKNSKMHCEYNSNFNLDDIENSIEEQIIRFGTKYIFFDYLQITSNLSRELIRLFGYVLREDQMLNQLSTALKNLANKYDVFIISSTQLNRNYKADSEIDVTSLRGGMATADKTDGVMIVMPVSNADIEKLKPLLAKGFKEEPTHAFHICKNRGRKWNRVIVWLNMNLDYNQVVEECFVTKTDYTALPISPTVIKMGDSNGCKAA